MDTAELTARTETLWERLDRLLTAGAPPPDVSPEELAPLLSPWAKAFARGDKEALSRRLAWDGLSPRQAAAALTSTQPAPPAVPAPWTPELERYLELASEAAGEPRREGSLPFEELWRPWVALAEAGLPEDARRGPELSDDARADLRELFLREIGAMSELAAYERFAAERQRAGEVGAYGRFVAAVLGDPVAGLYGDLPVLARRTVEIVRQWRGAVSELVRRLARDRPDLDERFGDGSPLGPVTGVRGGLSDRHHGGKQVMALDFACGVRLVYKPRGPGMEDAFGAWIAWCRDRGLEEAPPSGPRLLARDGYGWTDLVPQQELGERGDAEAYYRRAGALVAMAYVLRGQDLHAENVVATREGPVVVDAEMLLQPEPAVARSGPEEDSPPAGRRPSCVETGLLSQPERGAAGERRELGGLRAQPRSLSSRRARGWRDVNRDTMTLVAEDLWLEPRENAVWVDGSLVGPEEHAEALAAGFESTYRFLLERRDELLGDDGPLSPFRQVAVRVLFRRSQDYWTLLALQDAPRNQRSGLTGSLLHEALLGVFADLGERPVLWPLAADERAALERRDVPHFTVPAGATALTAADGTAVDGYFSRSGLDAVRRRIRSLDEDDLARQLTLLRRALEPPASPKVVAAGAEALPGSQGSPEERFRAAARAIAEALAARVAEGAPAALPWGTGHGRVGMALFLAAAGDALGDPGFARAAAELLEPLASSAVDLGPLGPGGLTGLGSVTHGLVWAARLLGQPRLLAAAARAAEWVSATAIAADRRFDVEGGAAGALLGLLAVAEAAEHEPALAAARACGEHLVEHQRVLTSAGAAWPGEGGLAPAGFAHGAGGIARALAALGERTGDERFAVAAAAALGYERTLYDPGRRNWPVLGLEPGGRRPARAWMVAWCHGAPGIALSRLYLPPAFHDAAREEELEAACATTAEAPASSLDHLCCGTLGRSSVLLTAAQLRQRPRLRAAAAALATGVLDRARPEGLFRLHTDPIENRRQPAGLLRGLAGVGYQMLRLAGAPGLPDLLALELPGEQRRRRDA